MKIVKATVNEAARSGIIASSPYAGCKSEVVKSTRTFLPKEDVECIRNLTVDTDVLYCCKWLFLLQVNTGLGYSDLCKLTADRINHYPNGFKAIVADRTKTAVDFTIPLNEEAQRIIEDLRRPTPTGSILPVPCAATQVFSRKTC